MRATPLTDTLVQLAEPKRVPVTVRAKPVSSPLLQHYDAASKGISTGEKVGWSLAGAAAGLPALWSMKSLWSVLPQAVEEYELVLAAPELLLPLIAL